MRTDWITQQSRTSCLTQSAFWDVVCRWHQQGVHNLWALDLFRSWSGVSSLARSVLNLRQGHLPRGTPGPYSCLLSCWGEAQMGWVIPKMVWINVNELYILIGLSMLEIDRVGAESVQMTTSFNTSSQHVGLVHLWRSLPSRKLTHILYPTLGKGKTIFKSAFQRGYVSSMEGQFQIDQ